MMSMVKRRRGSYAYSKCHMFRKYFDMGSGGVTMQHHVDRKMCTRIYLHDMGD